MEHVARTHDGFRFIQRGPETDDHLALGGHEAGLGPTLYAFARALETDSKIVVVGAHVGLWAIRLAQFCPVIAYEANPATAATLRRNVDLNRKMLLHYVQVREYAVWDVSGHHVSLTDENGKAEGGSTRAVEAPGSSVMTVALDDDGLYRVGLMVIDVEGAEAKVLRGARHILERDRPALVIEVHEGLPGTDPDLREQLDGELRRADYDWISLNITGERYLARHQSRMPTLDFEPEIIRGVPQE